MTGNQHMAVNQADALLTAQGLPSYTELLLMMALQGRERIKAPQTIIDWDSLPSILRRQAG